jgi:ribosomal protein L40E
MQEKICPKCNAIHTLKGTYCSRKCANSRGPRTEEFKEKVRSKLKGVNHHTEEGIIQGILAKGLFPSSLKPNTHCVVCSKDTGTKRRKTCSEYCYRRLIKMQSQTHPNCGGQKNTHRSKIMNIKGDVFIAESSYEVMLSEIFNSLNMLWVRPDFVWYTDSKGSKRRYYPDFYLPDFDIYFDPKNEYLIKTDIDKINRASKQNDIFIIVIGIDHINVDVIKGLVGNRGNAPLHPVCKTGTLLLS